MLLVSLLPSQTNAVNPKKIFNDDFHAQIEDYLNQTNAKSGVISVIKENEPFYSHGYGEQPELDKVYQIASITKSFCAMVILHLQEQGLLNIEDPINDYLPFIVRDPEYPDTPIKIKHLLSHQSGISDGAYFAYIRCEYPRNISMFSEILYNFLNENGTEYSNPFKFQAGTGFIYSNLGFDHLAYIAELASGMSYSDYLSVNILTPLGMNDTRLDYHDYDPTRLIKIGHINYDGRGCGGLWTTISDLERFLIMHMNNGTYKGTQILNETSINLMHAKHVQPTEDEYIDFYGYGWYYNDSLQGHSGGGVCTSNMFFNDSIGVIYFINYFYDTDFPIYIEMRKYIWGVAYNGIYPDSANYLHPLTLIALMTPILLLIRRRRKQTK